MKTLPDHIVTVHRLLVSQQFICPTTHPELFQQLREDSFAEAVNDFLAGLGYRLSWVGDDDSPEVFFCGLVSLDDSDDRKHAEKTLLDMRDQISACIEFFRLVDHAGQGRISLISGGELPFYSLLSAIDAQTPYIDQLRDLQGLKLFESTRNAKDNGDRLARVFKVMVDQGYLVLNHSESKIYLFTGKLAYLQRILGWLADYHNIPITEPEQRQEYQGGLF